MLQEIKGIRKCSIDDDNRTLFICSGMTCESAEILSSSKVKLIDINYVIHQVPQVLVITNGLQEVNKCGYAPIKCVNDSQEENCYSNLYKIIE